MEKYHLLILLAYLLMIAFAGYWAARFIRYWKIKYELDQFRRNPDTQYAFMRHPMNINKFIAVRLKKQYKGTNRWMVERAIVRHVTPTYYKMYRDDYLLKYDAIWPEWYVSTIKGAEIEIHNAYRIYFTIQPTQSKPFK